MDFSKILPIILALIGGTGRYADIIRKVLELMQLIMAADAASTPVMDVKWAQAALAKLGFDPGPVDGIMGSKTQAAIKAYQAARGLEQDGWLGVATQAKLAQEVPPT